MCMLSTLIQEMFVFLKALYVYYCTDLTNCTNLHNTFFLRGFQNDVPCFKEFGVAEVQMATYLILIIEFYIKKHLRL